MPTASSRILACIGLESGERRWKGERYGNGQLVLLPDQDLLRVLSEEGELALVGATADAFKEVARFQGIQGKTWNTRRWSATSCWCATAPRWPPTVARSIVVASLT